MQQIAYDLLVNEVDAKRAEILCIKDDITELKESMLKHNEPVKSSFEIEALRNEIRALTNENAKLELSISKGIFLDFELVKAMLGQQLPHFSL